MRVESSAKPTLPETIINFTCESGDIEIDIIANSQQRKRNLLRKSLVERRTGKKKSKAKGKEVKKVISIRTGIIQIYHINFYITRLLGDGAKSEERSIINFSFSANILQPEPRLAGC